jgi:tetratricopeptide (TPR) repeat protein
MKAESSRIDKLQAMLAKQPDDTFLHYGIGMEYRKLEQPEKALEYFEQVLKIDPTYLYAYYQQGQVYELLGNLPAARQSYREGIEAAERKGDAHAREELAAALEMIE